VLAIGRFSQEKGHDVLIRAFARVAARLPEWQLKIVGEGPAHAHLSTLAAKLGIQNRVTLAPVTKDVLGEYLQADIFVLPSRFEGFPNTLIEAMQSGCAVIAADCPVAPREILSDGKNGLLFRNEDDEHLAELLSVLMHDPDRRSALGEGAVLAVKRYAPEVILSLWDGLIEACANIK
jgi:glycosyltransferase involved in cell wall biosynthesis